MSRSRSDWLYLLAALIGCGARDLPRVTTATGSTAASASAPTTEPTSSDTGATSDASATSTASASSTGTTHPSDADSTGTASAGATGTTHLGDTTDEPLAECGNGIVEDFGRDPEDCDDGNDIPDDGCRDCGRDRLVFVTSELYQGGVFDGLAGADQRCRSLADQAGLPNFAGYKAWLSDSQTDARDRLFHGRGRYVLVNGLVVADDWDALVGEPLQNPINVTQTSESLDYFAWTGTNPDGTAIEGADHCADWTKINFSNQGYWGDTQAVSAEWTLAVSKFDQPDYCGAEYALYCIEQE